MPRPALLSSAGSHQIGVGSRKQCRGGGGGSRRGELTGGGRSRPTVKESTQGPVPQTAPSSQSTAGGARAAVDILACSHPCSAIPCSQPPPMADLSSAVCQWSPRGSYSLPHLFGCLDPQCGGPTRPRPRASARWYWAHPPGEQRLPVFNKRDGTTLPFIAISPGVTRAAIERALDAPRTQSLAPSLSLSLPPPTPPYSPSIPILPILSPWRRSF